MTTRFPLAILPPRRRVAAVALACLVVAVTVRPAAAHPMGNFSINHYAHLQVEADEVRIRYRLDLAEISAAQEMSAIDTDGDRQVSDAERAAYMARKVPQLVAALELTVDDQPARLQVVTSELRVRPGAADLPTLLITIDCRAPLSADPPRIGQRFVIRYRDHNYAERAGWREVCARNGPGCVVIQSDVPRGERSQALEAYPENPTEAPPQETEANLEIKVTAAPATRPAVAGTGGGSSASPGSAGGGADRNRGTPQDRFTALITTKELSAWVLLASLGVAFVLGSFHALSPGHGKTVVAAYLVGSRGTARHAALLGLVVTTTHVAGVFLLGLAVLFASRYVLPEQLYPWLGFASGFLIVAVGVWQFTSRLALLHASRQGPGGGPGGAAMLHGHHHGPGGHTHELPDRITLGGLVALGVSGGMVPCPSALVVMLSAIALRRTAFGLLLIVVFSLGLASVLIAIGLLMLYARRLVDRLKWEGTLLRRLPLASPLIVAGLGAAIAAQSLIAGGILPVKSAASAASGPAAAAAGR